MKKQIKLIHRSVDEAAIVRREPDGKNYIEFYAAVFNQKSKLIREWGEVFYEIISATAFTNVLADPGLNCLATVNHKRDHLLGRNKSGTLTLSVDQKGLKATVEMPDTQLGRDMMVLIERGDYYECSFIYTIAENGVQYDRSPEIPVRTINAVQDLYDVSIVLDGAFANTEIKKRAADMEMEDEEENTDAKPEDEEDDDEEEQRALKIEADILQKRLNLKRKKYIL